MNGLVIAGVVIGSVVGYVFLGAVTGWRAFYYSHAKDPTRYSLFWKEPEPFLAALFWPAVFPGMVLHVLLRKPVQAIVRWSMKSTVSAKPKNF